MGALCSRVNTEMRGFDLANAVMLAGVAACVLASCHLIHGIDEGTLQPQVDPCAGVECAPEGVCDVRKCDPDTGRCVLDLSAVPSLSQVTGDCKRAECEGGQVVSTPDPADLPIDANPCTEAKCQADVPLLSFLPSGSACNGTGTCDAAGNCSACTSPSECGDPAECGTRTCNGSCGWSFLPAGTVAGTQTAGDCKLSACTGMSEVPEPKADPTDFDDGDPCTEDACSGLSAVHKVMPGAPCDIGVCSAEGTCVECVTAADCASNPKGENCTGNVCGCGSDTHCNSPLRPKCFGGTCGCINNQHCDSPEAPDCLNQDHCGCDSNTNCGAMQCINELCQ